MNEQTTAKPIFTREILERLHAPAPPHIKSFLDESYPLDADKIDAYQDGGYVKLEGSSPANHWTTIAN